MSSNYSTIQQHEPLRVPPGWGTAEKRLVAQLEEILDDLYSRFNRLKMKDLAASLQKIIKESAEGVTELSVSVDGINTHMENVDGRLAEMRATVDGLSVTLEDGMGQLSEFQLSLNDLALALSNENGAMTALKVTVDGLMLLMENQENLSAYLRITENGLEIGREGDPAKFRADNRTLEVTNLKTERVSITQSMSQDAEWAWIATKSGLGLKYIGG